MITIKNVLVPTDFGEAADSALTYGRTLARNFGARLHVLHVVDNALLFAGTEGIAYDFALVQTQIEDAARKKLADLVGSDGITVVRSGTSPAFVIVDYAKENNVDLIVVGTHGRGMMAHLLIGSVAERVVRMSPCPVLTVRNPEHEFVIPDALEVAVKAKG